MSFSRQIFDSLVLGTSNIAGVQVQLFASSRAPYDGTYTTTKWQDATNYLVGNAVVYKGQVYNAVQVHVSSLGVNDPDSDTYDPQGVGTFWKKVDGKDGDVWFKSSGATSATYQKKNGIWSDLTNGFNGAAIPLGDNQSGALAYTYDASSKRTAIIDYYIADVAGNIERGQFAVVNNGTDLAETLTFRTFIGSALGIDISFNLSGVDVELLYDSTLTPTNRNLFLIIRS